jgi:hypothetical protein
VPGGSEPASVASSTVRAIGRVRAIDNLIQSSTAAIDAVLNSSARARQESKAHRWMGFEGSVEALRLVGVRYTEDLFGDEALIALSSRHLAKDPSFDEFPYVRRCGSWRNATKEGRCVSQAHGWTFE